MIANYQKEIPLNGVILACTELPLVHKNFPILTEKQLPIIDTVTVLANKLVQLSLNDQTI